jgi:hypothetical protein
VTADTIASQAFGLVVALGLGVTGFTVLGSWIVRLRQAGQPS